MIGKDVSISSDEVDNNSISSDQMSTQPELFALDELLDRSNDSNFSDEDSSCCSTMSLTSSEGEEFDSLDECLEAYSLAEYIQSQHNWIVALLSLLSPRNTCQRYALRAQRRKEPSGVHQVVISTPILESRGNSLSLNFKIRSSSNGTYTWQTTWGRMT
jgi:hypothetical protein